MKILSAKWFLLYTQKRSYSQTLTDKQPLENQLVISKNTLGIIYNLPAIGHAIKSIIFSNNYIKQQLTIENLDPPIITIKLVIRPLHNF